MKQSTAAVVERRRAKGSGRPEPVSNYLHPFPESWYFIATRKEIEEAKLIQKTWMGENVVIWSDGSGRVCVADAICPHLGADLGPISGGRVADGRLVCPFHGFQYSTTGQCVATPYADAPKNARLRVFETRDVCGLIFAWWGNGGREPQWHLPEDPPNGAEWSDFEIRTLRFPGHPQETAENSVDLGHLRYVHGYDQVDRVDKLTVDGPHLQSFFKFSRSSAVAKLGRITFNVSARTHIWGMGYSYVEIREHSVGMDMHLWILATPVDGTLIDFSIVSKVREIRSPKRWLAGLGFLPVKWRAPLMNKFVVANQEHDVQQDIAIWGPKQYRSRPRLCRSDGEIMPYRTYCAQFYPDATTS